MFLITYAPIDVCAIVSKAVGPENGAIATFMGVVRGHSGQQKVHKLFYEAYAPMALKSFEKIDLEARSRWKISELSIVHRVGMLSVGETAVLILVSSEHRRDALSACAYAIERVKQIAPIWKKEFFENHQGVWLEDYHGSSQKEHALI